MVSAAITSDRLKQMFAGYRVPHVRIIPFGGAQMRHVGSIARSSRKVCRTSIKSASTAGRALASSTEVDASVPWFTA